MLSSSSQYTVYSAWMEISADCGPPGVRWDLRSTDGSERESDYSNRDHGKILFFRKLRPGCRVSSFTLKCFFIYLFPPPDSRPLGVHTTSSASLQRHGADSDVLFKGIVRM